MLCYNYYHLRPINLQYLLILKTKFYWLYKVDKENFFLIGCNNGTISIHVQTVIFALISLTK